MYDYREFSEKMESALADYFGEGFDVKLLEVQKNNGVVLKGVNIRDNSKCISPTIYLEEIFACYEKGQEFSELFKSIVDVYEKYKGDVDVNTDMLTDFGLIRDRIVYKLINTGANEELLKQVPHIPYLDMAVVFYYTVTGQGCGQGTILIRNELADMWKMDAGALMELAGANTPRLLSPNLSDIRDVLLQGSIMELDSEMGELLTARSMYVLSNSQKLFGASSIMYPGVLEDFSRTVDTNLFVLPSSVHEVIIVPERDSMTAGDFKDIVKSVNDTQLDPVDVLSDSVYYYDRESAELRVSA